ncbi:hypothetical protein [Micromonospora sp. CPCC 205558]|uniref:hypothetical protein n=1 Tax=Micromonospora sp. CPCC 205558 TaxID=3122403 RepID=UPI002FEFCCBB
MPYREQPMSAAWLPPRPIPRRMPDGAILVRRRMSLTPDGPVPAGYELLRPDDEGFAAWASFLDIRQSAE